MSDMTLLRIGILVATSLLLARDHLLRPAAESRAGQAAGARPADGARHGAQLPTTGTPAAASGQHGEAQPRGTGLPDGGPATSELGKRIRPDSTDRFAVRRRPCRQELRGQDIVVAAEKAGLTFGHMNVFHRLVDGHPERGPIFSVANIIKPGSFDMARSARWKPRLSRSS